MPLSDVVLCMYLWYRIQRLGLANRWFPGLCDTKHEVLLHLGEFGSASNRVKAPSTSFDDLSLRLSRARPLPCFPHYTFLYN